MAGEWPVDVPLPALLRSAWTTYGGAVRAAMADAGFDDLPRNGAYVLGAIADAEVPLARVIERLGLSKQAAGQLIDTLVLRGYVERATDPADRRRLTVSVTRRGVGAATVAKQAIAGIDRALTERIGAGELTRVRRALATMIEIGSAAEDP
jgi:DNA-binding MarR family transcriptional regulator